MTPIQTYLQTLPTETDQNIGQHLMQLIDTNLNYTESKIWHAHPVWFINGNQIVGFSKQKAGIRLMFWSGADFNEDQLNIKGAKFKDASIFYNNLSEINLEDLLRWFIKAETIQWDYKNIVKRKGVLERLR